MNLNGQIALITGASRGIGKAIALKFSEYGAQVIINYSKDQTGAEAVAKEILEKYGKEIFLIQCSVSEPEAVKNMFKEIKTRFGGLDILVNNAGITKDGFLMTMKESDWDSVISVNLKGLYNCSKNSLPLMIQKKGGRIINISSVSGLSGKIAQTNYSTTKAGIIGFTRSLSKEVARYNIIVNAIAPGFIETEMVAKIPENLKNEYLKQIPLARMGKAEEIAELAAFLASDKAAYIVGQTIVVDGGLIS